MMHAQAQRTIPGFPMPSGGTGVRDLTRLQIADVEVVNDASHQLRRCATESQFAEWAATWGEVLIARCAEHVTTTRKTSNTRRLRS